MNHVVTVGMIVWPALAIVGSLIAICGLVWVLSVIASEFNH